MNRYRKLLSNTAVYGIGTFASKLLVFFLTRLYTECLTRVEYSTVDLITNMANLLIPLAAAGVCDGIFRFTLDSENDKKNVFSTGITLLLCSGGIFLLLSPLLALIPYYRQYVWIIVLYVLMSNFHSACAQYIRALDKTKLFAVQGIINTVLTIFFNVLFLVVLPDNSYFNGVEGYVLSIVIADFIVGAFLVLYAKLYRDIRPRYFRRDLAKSIVTYSIPLIPTTIFWWITNLSDRYMVSYFNGEAENGLYVAAYKIPTLLTLVTGVFSEAWQFSAVKESNSEEHSNFYSTVFSCFQALIFVVAAGVIAFSKIFSKILFADDYYMAWRFIPVLVLSSVFSSFVVFLSSVYMVKKRSLKSLLTSMIGAISNIILNFILIPTQLNFGTFTVTCAGWGGQGAAIATLASYVIVFVVRMLDTRKILKFDAHITRLAINSIITVLGIVGMLYIDDLLLLTVLQATVFVLIVAINLKPLIRGINTAINSIKRK